MVGNSHARRICQAMKRNLYFQENHVIYDCSRPGGVWNDLEELLPNPEYMEENAITIVASFSNSFLQKNVLIEGKGEEKRIHLLKYKPTSYGYRQQILEKAKSYLTTLPGMVLVIDHIYRHAVPCCGIHPFAPEIDQRGFNNQVTNYLEKDSQIKVLKHLQLMGVPTRLFRNVKKYNTLLADGVHLRREGYTAIATGLEEYCRI